MIVFDVRFAGDIRDGFCEIKISASAAWAMTVPTAIAMKSQDFI